MNYILYDYLHKNCTNRGENRRNKIIMDENKTLYLLSEKHVMCYIIAL